MRFLFSFIFLVHALFFFCTVLCSRRVPHTTYIRRVNKKRRKFLFCLMVSLCLFHTFSLNFFRLPDLNGSRTEKLSSNTHTHTSIALDYQRKTHLFTLKSNFFFNIFVVSSTLCFICVIERWVVLRNLVISSWKRDIVFSSRCDWAKHELLRVHHYILEKNKNKKTQLFRSFWEPWESA
jgi:hypothetical protein